jgi:Mn2+/Fe2+ NRAMP family transporter
MLAGMLLNQEGGGPMSSLIVLLVVVVCVALAVALAYLPMRLLVGQMARNMVHFIQRQRDRRRVERETPDRRKTTS